MDLVPVIVGAALVLGGFAKAVDLTFAGAQIERYGVLSEVKAQWAAALLAMLEAGLGAALIAGAYSRAAGVATIAALVTLTILALWVSRGKDIEECGCYGRLLKLSPAQSAGLNVFFCIALLAWLLLAEPIDDAAGPYALAAVAATVLAVGGLARYTAYHGAPLFFSPFRPGRHWPAQAMADAGLNNPAIDPALEDVIVVLATQACSICRSWLRSLDLLARAPGELPVLGILGAGAAPLEEFRRELRLDIPLAQIPDAELLRLWSRPPLAVLVRQGVIAECWRGRLPAAVVERIRARVR